MSSLNFGCKFLLIAKKYNSGQKETKIGNGERRTETEGKGHLVYHSDIAAIMMMSLHPLILTTICLLLL